MSNIIKAIKFVANNNNVKIIKAMLATQSRISNMIVDRAHLAATMANELVKSKDNPDAILDLLLPGARQEIENLHARVNRIHQQDSCENAAQKISETGLMSLRDAEAMLAGLDMHHGVQIVDKSAAVLTGAKVIYQDELMLVMLAYNKFYVSTDLFRETFKTR